MIVQRAAFCNTCCDVHLRALVAINMAGLLGHGTSSQTVVLNERKAVVPC